MTSKLSFAELSKLYGSSNKPPAALEASTVLAGTTTLDKLSKLFFSRESSKLFAAPCVSAAASSSSLSLSSSSSATGGSKQGIAICLVIVDDLYHEALWREWVELSKSSVKYEARLFIHAKHPERISSAWVRSCLLQGRTFKPEWNSPEVIRAMLAILGEAVPNQELRAGRFVFGTESCIPIHTLDAVGDALFKEDVSWLNSFDAGKTNWETGACFRSVDPAVIPPRAVWKTIPGWMMLNRRHAAEIVNLQACIGDDLVRAWGPGGPWREGRGVWAPEEVFFSTMLALLGYLRKGGADEVRRRTVTYAAWARDGEANPIFHNRLTPSLLAEFRQTGCLFARKFARGSVSLSEWRALICSNSAPQSAAAVAPAAASSAAAALATAALATAGTAELNKRGREEIKDAENGSVAKKPAAATIEDTEASIGADA